jgi:hypothetical protein
MHGLYVWPLTESRSRRGIVRVGLSLCCPIPSIVYSSLRTEWCVDNTGTSSVYDQNGNFRYLSTHTIYMCICTRFVYRCLAYSPSVNSFQDAYIHVALGDFRAFQFSSVYERYIKHHYGFRNAVVITITYISLS